MRGPSSLGPSPSRAKAARRAFCSWPTTRPTPKRQWKEFPGVYRCYPTAGAKAGATIYANFGDPRVQNEHGQPILFAAQFYGSGRTLYLGSPEMWRLRAVDEAFFERFWTKAIREVGQGRLRRGTARGLLLLERSQYALGQTIRIRANLLDPQLNPLEVESVELDVFDPHGAPLDLSALAPTRSRQGRASTGPTSGPPCRERIACWCGRSPRMKNRTSPPRSTWCCRTSNRTTRVRTRNCSQTWRARPGGKYLPIEKAAVELPALLPDRGERFAVDEQLRALWDQEWVLYLLVGLLGFEWVIRKLLRLA